MPIYARLDKFNTLPPKPEYLKKVRVALKSSSVPVKLAELVAQTGLTNTQALCALNLMLKNGEALKLHGSNSFCLVALEVNLSKDLAK